MPADARITWGSTSLMPTVANPEQALRAGTYPTSYIIEASADGTDWGEPQAVITAIRSHLQDGSLGSVTSFDNRQGTIRIRVTALTYDGLAIGEAALVAETKVAGYSTLTWTPNMSVATPTVFDVVYSTLAWEQDDLQEVKTANAVIRRYFVASLELLPFGRDVALTTVAAANGLPPAQSITSVNDGTTTTGWTAAEGGGGSLALVTPTASGGRVTVTGATYTAPNPSRIEVLRYAGSIVVTTNRYIFIDYATTNAPNVGVNASVNGGSATSGGGTAVALTLVSTSAQAGGLTRAYYSIPTAVTTVTSVAFQTSHTMVDGTQATFSIDQLSTANTLPVTTTNRERSRTAAIDGSARARATIVLTADSTKTLGDLTMVYTRSVTTGFQPPLQPYSTATGTADTTLISGQYRTALSTTAVVYRIPARLLKEAGHNLVLRVRNTSAATASFTYTAALKTSAGATLPESTQSITGTVSYPFPVANTWQTVEAGILQLPTVPIASDSTHVMEITLTSNSATVQLDEAWLFDLDNGVLSWVNTTGLTRLEIRAADLTNPEPTYWGGTVDGGAATGLVRADYRAVPVLDSSGLTINGASFAQHFIEPGTVDIFTVTSGTEGSAASVLFYRAWQHNARA